MDLTIFVSFPQYMPILSMNSQYPLCIQRPEPHINVAVCLGHVENVFLRICRIFQWDIRKLWFV